MEKESGTTMLSEKFSSEKQSPKRRDRSLWQRIGKGIIVFAIAMGILCRVVNLDIKPLWMDETYTLLRASGYTAQEAQNFIQGGKIVRAGDYLRFQQPSAEKGIQGTIEGLALEEPQHPPLYFILTRFWEEILGSSKTSVRLLSAIFGILGIPAMFWLGWELFRDRQVAALATAFYSLSPLFVQLAQSARQYSLWLTLMLTATALLLQLLRRPKAGTGWLYGIILAIGFYTHLLTGLVILGHGLYVLLYEFILHKKKYLTVAIKRWGLALLLAVGCIFPWLYLVWQNRDIARSTTDWLRQPALWTEWMQAWILALGKGFVALHFSYYQIVIFAAIPLLGLMIYAFYFVYRRSAPYQWGMISCLAGTAFLPFLAADILWGGRRTWSDRYFLLCYVCIYLAVAFLLVAKMQGKRKANLWRGVTLGLLTLSLVSTATGALGTSWWGWSEFDHEIPPIVQQAEHPLLVVNVPFFDSFRFAHEYHPDVDLMLLQNPQDFRLPTDHENLFFLNPAPPFQAQLRAEGLKLTPVYHFTDTSTDFHLVVYQAKFSDRSHSSKSWGSVKSNKASPKDSS